MKHKLEQLMTWEHILKYCRVSKIEQLNYNYGSEENI